MDMLENIWEDIVGGSKPSFGNLDQAHNQLQVKINGISQPILVVLDDVCSRSNLQRLLFQGEHYKTLVTTRDENIIRKQNNVRLFPLQSLQEDHAMSLFCYHAFGEPTIPATATHYEELVKQVQAQCDGLLLALQVIGSSLRDEPPPVWKSAKNKLSRGATIGEFHKEELFERLKTTIIDVLEENVKQCFMDLAVFPQGRTFCVDVLLDIWVYVRGMDWMDAFVILIELIARSLLELKRDPSLSELKRDPWGPGITQECANGLLFSQHNVIRDLALYLVEKDKLSDCSRLCMPEKSDCIPSNWQTVQASKAQIVSVHTGDNYG
ncbi:putative disease resistance protein At5g47280 [Cryptomeria japonica]|uniref:putative disease resistance protein At5g47280 n=1 Tax=Cryptomeria japonica TaxID=3369 RepID=UPI0027DA29A4|nr:putative disease resistance protein At5g47280 [Cryptomeria japonica]